MSGDQSGQKTEQPTRKKILDSRKEGQVAVSKELTLAFVAIIVMALIFFMKVKILSLCNSTFEYALERIISSDLVTYKIISIYYYALEQIFIIIFLIITATIVFIIAFVSFQMGGIVLVTKRFMKFDINNMNPVNNAKNIFSMKNFVKFIKNVLHILIQAGVAYWVVKTHYSDGTNVIYYDLPNIIHWMLLFFGHLLLLIFLSGIIFGILDLLWEKRTLNKKLMMSLEEIKKEYKETEGNPEIKGHRRQLHREILEGGDEGFASNATMVLANPTHYAIVIMYKPKQYLQPIILYKAKNYKAQLIFQKARKYDIPIIHDKWLARSLYDLTEPGDTVPKSLNTAFMDMIKSNIDQFPTLVEDMRVAIESNLAKLQELAGLVKDKNASSVSRV
jgi:flagellar biosynthesis protein FlhB